MNGEWLQTVATPAASLLLYARPKQADGGMTSICMGMRGCGLVAWRGESIEGLGFADNGVFGRNAD